MELIRSIQLSSGTVVNIPTFYDNSSGTSRRMTSRSGAVLIDYRGSILVKQAYSNADIIELGNILLNSDKTTLDLNTPTLNGHSISYLFWSYYNNTWNLELPFTVSVNGIMMEYVRMGITSEYYYYDGENTYITTPTEMRNFTTAVEYAKQHSMSDNLYNTNGDYLQVSTIRQPIRITENRRTLEQIISNINSYIEDNPDADISIITYDPDTNNPYIYDGGSTIGGGGGSYDDPDEIDKASIPALPTISATNTGLVTMYGATNTQLQALGGYLWSNLWDIETNFKKLYSDPMDCLVGLSILPCTPSLGAATSVKFGNITTGIALNVLASQYVEVDCGSVNVKEFVGSFLDYSPYVNISIYLPYVGYRELSPDDVMNDTIHVVYHIDCLTGACCAMIETSKKGLLYSYNGSCSCNVPLTAINYSGAIQNAVSAVGAGLTTVAGIATGAAPIAAMGAMSALSNAANTAMNSKPSVQRSGAMGGAAGLMSRQKPMLIITRPRMCVPDKLNKFIGLTTHVTLNLSQCKGFTQIELIHLDNVPCTDDERDELLTLLTQGVIF